MTTETVTSTRRGVSLPEALVAMVVGMLVLQLALATMSRLRAQQQGLTARAGVLAFVRVARHVVAAELRRAGPGAPGAAVSADTLGVRAFRGTAAVCPGGETDEFAVSYRGDRQPDPAKDSVLLITHAGVQTTRKLVRVAGGPAACGTAAATSLWRLDAPAPEGTVLARLFERGAYHLAGSALRYRVGASGRQPLTPEVARTPPSRWIRGSGALHLELLLEGAGAPQSRTLLLPAVVP